MSIYLGRIRRVYTGWRAVPGKNLIIFDDALVEVRASALDGIQVYGVASASGSAFATQGAKLNAFLDNKAWAPEKLVGLHSDNWMLMTSAINSATLTTRQLGIRRRLTLHTEGGTRVVEWEGNANPDLKIVRMFKQILGDRFVTTGRLMRLLGGRYRRVATADQEPRVQD
jgi:hypothetical protein